MAGRCLLHGRLPFRRQGLRVSSQGHGQREELWGRRPPGVHTGADRVGQRHPARDKGWEAFQRGRCALILTVVLVFLRGELAGTASKKYCMTCVQVHTFMPDLAPLAGEGMVAKTFADPGAVLAAANAKIAETLGL